MTELNFKFADGARWKTGRFEIEGLTLDGTGVDYTDVKLYLDGQLYTGGIHTWAVNDVSTDFLFGSIFNSWLRDETFSFKSFSEEWNVFQSVKDMAEKQGDLIVKLPVYNYGEVVLYDLGLATERNRYYSHSDDYLMLDANGRVVTDIEAFFLSALDSDICEMLKGKPVLYKSDDIDEYVDSQGGPEEFLEEFDR